MLWYDFLSHVNAVEISGNKQWFNFGFGFELEFPTNNGYGCYAEGYAFVYCCGHACWKMICIINCMETIGLAWSVWLLIDPKWICMELIFVYSIRHIQCKSARASIGMYNSGRFMAAAVLPAGRHVQLFAGISPIFRRIQPPVYISILLPLVPLSVEFPYEAIWFTLYWGQRLTLAVLVYT